MERPIDPSRLRPVCTVDFESMLNCPKPDHIIEKRGEIVPGMTNTWYIYLPKSFDETKTYPLVVDLHGGHGDGLRWAQKSLWHVLAEEHDLIILYPSSPRFEAWVCDDMDVEYLYDLIELTCREYPVDRTRIFTLGMSNGDLMNVAFTIKHPEILAAAGFTTGPALQSIVGDERPCGPLPVIQMRGEKDAFYEMSPPWPDDIYAKRYGMNDFNREIWIKPNGLNPHPTLTIRGKDNFLKYKGEHGDLINWEVRDAGHRKVCDEAQVYWDCLFSGCRRVDGKIIQEEPESPLPGDEDGVFVTMGTTSIYRTDHPVSFTDNQFAVVRLFEPKAVPRFAPIPLDEMLETPALYAPAEIFEAAFDAKLEHLGAGQNIRITMRDGTVLELTESSPLVCINGKYRAMKKPSVHLCGIFYVPIGELCGDILGMCVSEAENSMYISNHPTQLGRYTARIMRRILNAQN